MQVVGRILGAVAMIGLLAGSAAAQKGPAKYGEEDKPKTPSEIAAEKEAERAYRRSLGNIPEQQKSSDPWGTMRGDSAPPKAAAKAPPPAKPKAKSAEGAAK
ncbi:hypothetical protein [Bradyrhizobium australiense]|uniref:Uncharacterized protein n=1 Tax=Bradyrhizobium australiense TaxID=2721161 RepID=A0A7Y4GWK3_9BRAD|nr:hypothetical protein [Bradyrhizobium australiense]NOJ43251.1 hypothetical protein [Bradyrhizobium australiense]